MLRYIQSVHLTQEDKVPEICAPFLCEQEEVCSPDALIIVKDLEEGIEFLLRLPA